MDPHNQTTNHQGAILTHCIHSRITIMWYYNKVLVMAELEPAKPDPTHAGCMHVPTPCRPLLIVDITAWLQVGWWWLSCAQDTDLCMAMRWQRIAKQAQQRSPFPAGTTAATRQPMAVPRGLCSSQLPQMRGRLPAKPSGCLGPCAALHQATLSAQHRPVSMTGTGDPTPISQQTGLTQLEAPHCMRHRLTSKKS